MKLIYLGSGDIGLPTLRALLAAHATGRHELLAVVTQPDRPVGRHQTTLAPGPIKALALEAGMPVLQPERIRRPEAVEALRALGADVFVVFAYGQILPPTVLAVPRVACLNLHASLLPRHRGAAPIQAAILAGDAESGLTVMYMDEGLDTGDILLETRFRLAPHETGGSLHDRLAALAPDALLDALDRLAAGTAPRQPQDNSLATYAPKLDRAQRPDRLDARRRVSRPARPRDEPVAGRVHDASAGRRPRTLNLKIHEAVAAVRTTTQARRARSCAPTNAACSWRRVGGGICSCARCSLEGRKRLRADAFLRGHRCRPVPRLGRVLAAESVNFCVTTRARSVFAVGVAGPA